MAITNNDFFHLKDVKGNNVSIRKDDVYEIISRDDFSLFGMSANSILEFRKQYLLLSGQIPITQESVKNIFENRVA